MKFAMSLCLLFVSQAAWAQLVRGPYLQNVSPDAVTVMWRTALDEDTVVRFGTSPGGLSQSATRSTKEKDHSLRLTGLVPDTRYYYSVGNSAVTWAPAKSADQEQHTFVTPPLRGARRPFRFWVVGDDGNKSSAQALTISRMKAFVERPGQKWPDLFLHVGDMAYTDGTDSEFTLNHFGPHQTVLRRVPLWPAVGNHEGHSSFASSQSGPYYRAYELPTQGEAGGIASLTESYYSFDWANVHFVVLNSYDESRSTNGTMAGWLRSDLMATNQEWIVVYFHHPPYTRGTHSDTETAQREMRENILPILEANGVDLVLAGHSHIYERSRLLNGATKTPVVMDGGQFKDRGSGREDSGTGPYRKFYGLNPNDGTVYVVAGHGGASTGGSADHPVMYFSEVAYGSCLVDVDGDRLTLINLRNSDAVVSDHFTILKDKLPDGGTVVRDGGTADAGIEADAGGAADAGFEADAGGAADGGSAAQVGSAGGCACGNPGASPLWFGLLAALRSRRGARPPRGGPA